MPRYFGIVARSANRLQQGQQRGRRHGCRRDMLVLRKDTVLHGLEDGITQSLVGRCRRHVWLTSGHCFDCRTRGEGTGRVTVARLHCTMQTSRALPAPRSKAAPPSHEAGVLGLHLYLLSLRVFSAQSRAIERLCALLQPPVCREVSGKCT